MTKRVFIRSVLQGINEINTKNTNDGYLPLSKTDKRALLWRIADIYHVRLQIKGF